MDHAHEEQAVNLEGFIRRDYPEYVQRAGRAANSRPVPLRLESHTAAMISAGAPSFRGVEELDQARVHTHRLAGEVIRVGGVRSPGRQTKKTLACRPFSSACESSASSRNPA